MRISLKLQSKLLLPTMATLLILIMGASFVVSYIIFNEFRENSKSILAVANKVISKNIKNSVSSYKQTMLSIAHDSAIKAYANAVKTSDKETIDRSIDTVRALMSTLPISHPDFVQYNFANYHGDVIASSAPMSGKKVNC
ncbi:MAG: hypothetical protein IJS54_02280 [Desulfovibrio sp.]|nr:hypothetical protein [Desulfovibrio sp.]